MSSEEDIKKGLAGYLTRKWIEAPRRLNRARPVSQSELARLIGVPQGSLSQWMNGTRLPVEENRDKLAAYFGQEVYDILEVPRKVPPDKDLRRLIGAWGNLPSEERKQVADLVLKRAKYWQEKINS